MINIIIKYLEPNLYEVIAKQTADYKRRFIRSKIIGWMKNEKRWIYRRTKKRIKCMFYGHIIPEGFWYCTQCNFYPYKTEAQKDELMKKSLEELSLIFPEK